MIDLNTLFSRLYLNKGKKVESGLLKAKLLHIHNITGEGTTGYISQELWEAAEKEELNTLPVITKFMSHGAKPYKQRECDKSYLHVDKTPLNIILRRVRKVGIHQLKYLTETIKACGMTALLFDTPKSIKSFETVIQHLLQTYPYISIEGYNLDNIKNKMGRKLVVLAEFFALHDCIMIYGGKPEGFGLTISIIDPTGSQNQHQLLTKSFVNILFSKHRESIFVADGTEIRSVNDTGFVQAVISKFIEYALLYCVNNKNVPVASPPGVPKTLKYDHDKGIIFNNDLHTKNYNDFPSVEISTSQEEVLTLGAINKTHEAANKMREEKITVDVHKTKAYWKYVTDNATTITTASSYCVSD